METKKLHAVSLKKKKDEKTGGFGGKNVSVDTLKLAEMMLKMQRFEGINIRGANQKKSGNNGKHWQQKTESQQGNTTTKKTCYHFRGHNYRQIVSCAIVLSQAVAHVNSVYLEDSLG